MLKNYQKQFVQLSQEVSALKFGSFELKSGRTSPYFFNAGTFCTGASLHGLADCYAQKILDDNIEFDMLFGPAYKGIPLVAAISVILSQKTGKNIPWAFNRKEAKSHGEGGVMVGQKVSGKVLIVDDVITAGTAIREVLQLFEPLSAKVSGVLVALDRQEKAPNSNQSAMQIIANELDIQTHAILSLSDLIIASVDMPEIQPHMGRLKEYSNQYGI